MAKNDKKYATQRMKLFCYKKSTEKEVKRSAAINSCLCLVQHEAGLQKGADTADEQLKTTSCAEKILIALCLFIEKGPKIDKAEKIPRNFKQCDQTSPRHNAGLRFSVRFTLIDQTICLLHYSRQSCGADISRHTSGLFSQLAGHYWVKGVSGKKYRGSPT